MPINYSRERLADGIHYTTILNKQLKTNSIVVHMLTELSEETAAMNAIVPMLLAYSNAKIPDNKELNERLHSLYGANLSGFYSKYGDTHNLMLSASCINDRYCLEGERITEELAAAAALCLIVPHSEGEAFSKKAFALKKQELLDFIDSEINEKRSYAFKQAGYSIYKGEPAAIPASGSRKQAEKLTPEDTYRQYKKLLRTSQIEVFFVGAEPNEGCKKFLSDALLKIDRDYAGDNSSEISPPKSEVCRVTEPHDVAQSKMVMAFKTDCSDLAVLSLMGAIYGSTPFSKLFMNVREKLSLCYYCSSGHNSVKGTLFVDSGVEHTNAEKAEAEILAQLEAMKKGDFTDDETENARRTILNNIKGINDNPQSIAHWYFQRIYDGDIYSPEEYAERIKKVTREEIVAAANSLKLDTVYVLTGKEAV